MKRFRNILCIVAHEEEGGPALRRAVALAEANQARLTLVTVLPLVRMRLAEPGTPSAAQEIEDALRAAHTRTLEQLSAPHATRVPLSHAVLIGTGFLEIIRCVLKHDHDLVVKNAENPGFVERLFGSDDMQLLRECPCPVWLVHPDEKANYQAILAAVDFDAEVPGEHEAELNQSIIEFSSAVALTDPAALHVVHAWDAPAESMLRHWSNSPVADGARYAQSIRSAAEMAMDALDAELAARLGDEAYAFLAPEYHLVRGSAATVIPGVAREIAADLIVMGTVGRTGIAGLFIGNTAESVLAQVRCSVLAVKPPGFVTPVRVDP